MRSLRGGCKRKAFANESAPPRPRGQDAVMSMIPRAALKQRDACTRRLRQVRYRAMGKDIVHFKCHHCNHCCTEVVCLPTPWDVIRIVKHTGANPYEFLEFLSPEEISEVAKSDPTWLECDDGRYIMALRRDESGCHFLDKKTRYCGIYEARPILCRLYPFKLQETRDGKFRGFVLHKDVGCPRHQDGQVATQPLYELYLEDSKHQEDYDDLVRVFNRKKYAGKRPEDFIELFVKVAKPVETVRVRDEMPASLGQVMGVLEA